MHNLHACYLIYIALAVSWQNYINPGRNYLCNLCKKCSKFQSLIAEEFSVLTYYLQPHFQSVEKPKGGPLEIEIFFVEGGLRKVLEGGQEPSKTFLHLFNQQETKISNVVVDNT